MANNEKIPVRDPSSPDKPPHSLRVDGMGSEVDRILSFPITINGKMVTEEELRKYIITSSGLSSRLQSASFSLNIVDEYDGNGSYVIKILNEKGWSRGEIRIHRTTTTPGDAARLVLTEIEALD